MKAIVQSLLFLLANATDRELARQLQFLKVENEILRSKLPKRIHVSPAERNRLLKFGKNLGKAIYQLVSIVTPRTFLRWLKGDKRASKRNRVGRARTDQQIRKLVLRLASQNAWGYTRILGELKKLGISNISRSTIVNILRENGFDPGPKRGRATWSEFVKRHAQSLWACDFLQKKIWTLGGFVDYFVLFFIHVGSRRVYVTGITAQPDHAWICQQAHHVAILFQKQSVKPEYLLRDYDSKFSGAFDDILKGLGVEVIKVGPRAPNLNPHIERFLQTLQVECLDHFIIFGETHLRYLVDEFLDFYHCHRPHQGLDNELISGRPPPAEAKGPILCEQSLGGLLKHYYRKAA
jgi:putative transposase